MKIAREGCPVRSLRRHRDLPVDDYHPERVFRVLLIAFALEALIAWAVWFFWWRA
jgi:hypothetical protein